MKLQLNAMNVKKFRNITNTVLQFGSNLNIISGQNGVGKSNLLSLIAAGTGMAIGCFAADLSKTDAAFQPDFMDYFVINANLEKSIEPFHDYQVFADYVNSDNPNDHFSKFLRFKDDSNQQLASKKSRPVRVVPTTILLNEKLEKVSFVKDAQEFSRQKKISYEGRLKIPTQYLSISRLIPRGELPIESSKIAKASNYVTSGEAKKYQSWYNKVIPNSIEHAQPFKTDKGGFTQTVDELPTKSTLKSISVGQDSLSKIISALINFDIIKDDPNYHGGILCIDEFDISLHPDAQNRLLSLLERLSRELKVQIFLTTHSLTAIKKFFQMRKNLGKQHQNELGFIYLQDRAMPHLMHEPSYEKIYADLSVMTTRSHPNIKLYAEDEWTVRLFNMLVETCVSLKLLNKYNSAYIKCIDATFGKSNLIKLSQSDENFQKSILILDGDANYSDKNNYSKGDFILGKKKWPTFGNVSYYSNIVTLPFPFSPEGFIYYLANFYCTKVDDLTIRDFWISAEENVPFTRQMIDEKLLLPRQIVENLGNRLNTDFLKGKDSDAKRKMQLNDEAITALGGYNNLGKHDRMKILCDIVDDSHMCEHFYSSNSDRLEMLKDFAKKLDDAYITCQTKLLAKQI